MIQVNRKQNNISVRSSSSERYRGRSITEMIRNPTPEPEPIMANGVLTLESQACVVGASKVGKSIFTIGLGLCIAAGRNYLGIEVLKPCKVLYLNFEIHPALMEKRVKTIKDKLLIASDTPFRQLTLLGDDIPQANIEQGKEQLIDIIQAQDNFAPDVVILDDRWKITVGDPNQEENIKPLCLNLEAVRAKTGVVFIVVHHHGYNTPGVGAGSSAWDRWVNTAFDLIPHHWEGTKQGLRSSKEIKVEIGGNYTPGQTLYLVRQYPIFRVGGNDTWAQPISKRDEGKNLIISELQRGTIEESILRDRAKQTGITDSTFESAIKDLKQDGKIFTKQDSTKQGRHNLVGLRQLMVEKTKISGL